MKIETMTLTDFLLARIAEDEEWARLAGLAQDEERSRGVAFVSSLGSSSVTSAGRVLAECEAKRRIVAEYVDLLRWDTDHGDDHGIHGERMGMESAVKALALPYADHPDYREEWRP